MTLQFFIFYIDVDPANFGTYITGINNNDADTVERLYLNGARYKWKSWRE